MYTRCCLALVLKWMGGWRGTQFSPACTVLIFFLLLWLCRDCMLCAHKCHSYCPLGPQMSIFWTPKQTEFMLNLYWFDSFGFFLGGGNPSFSVLLFLQSVLVHPLGIMWWFCFSTMACFFLSHLSFYSSSSCAPSSYWNLPLPHADTSNKNQISKPMVCSVHPGEVLKLSCPLPATGTITWTKDGSSLGANNRTLIEQEVLQIRDATPKDSGLYTCTSVGKDTVCFIVNVTGESGTCQDKERGMSELDWVGSSPGSGHGDVMFRDRR